MIMLACPGLRMAQTLSRGSGSAGRLEVAVLALCAFKNNYL